MYGNRLFLICNSFYFQQIILKIWIFKNPTFSCILRQELNTIQQLFLYQTYRGFQTLNQKCNQRLLGVKIYTHTKLPSQGVVTKVTAIGHVMCSSWIVKLASGTVLQDSGSPVLFIDGLFATQLFTRPPKPFGNLIPL